MRKPTERQKQALQRLLSNSEFADEVIGWIRDDREDERAAMESAAAHKTEVLKGRCQKCTDLIAFLESLGGSKKTVRHL